MLKKFLASITASSSQSICYQTLCFLQMMMMHIGIFLLVFYLVLVHLFPGKKKMTKKRRRKVGNMGLMERRRIRAESSTSSVSFPRSGKD